MIGVKALQVKAWGEAPSVAPGDLSPKVASLSSRPSATKCASRSTANPPATTSLPVSAMPPSPKLSVGGKDGLLRRHQGLERGSGPAVITKRKTKTSSSAPRASQWRLRELPAFVADFTQTIQMMYLSVSSIPRRRAYAEIQFTANGVHDWRMPARGSDRASAPSPTEEAGPRQCFFECLQPCRCG